MVDSAGLDYESLLPLTFASRYIQWTLLSPIPKGKDYWFLKLYFTKVPCFITSTQFIFMRYFRFNFRYFALNGQKVTISYQHFWRSISIRSRPKFAQVYIHLSFSCNHTLSAISTVILVISMNYYCSNHQYAYLLKRFWSIAWIIITVIVHFTCGTLWFLVISVSKIC